MKYVKLFENWLNEAEVKPFDAKKSLQTKVVDITNENFAKADVKQQKYIIMGILNKCFAKKEDFEEGETKIYSCIYRSNTNDVLKLDIPGIGECDVRTGNKNTIFPGWDKMGKFDEKNCFFVALEKDTKILSGTYGDQIQPTTKPDLVRLIIFPVGGDDPKDFLLNSKWLVQNCNKEAINAEKSFYETTLGCIAAWASDQFKDANTLNNKNAGKPQEIAKALGYEIPENYTPGQGVETSK
jgi:hypothetical protein